MDNCAEASLALDNDVGDTHLTAESRKEDDKLDGVDVVRDHDESGLLSLDESDDVVKAVLREEGLLGVLSILLLLLSSGGGSSSEAGLLLLLGFRAVLVEELEQLGGGVLIEGVGELGDGRGDLEALVEDDLLALKANVLGPLHEAGEVSLGLDVLTYRCRNCKISNGCQMTHSTYQYRSSWGQPQREGSS